VAALDVADVSGRLWTLLTFPGALIAVPGARPGAIARVTLTVAEQRA
jgi:hypothetical protein